VLATYFPDWIEAHFLFFYNSYSGGLVQKYELIKTDDLPRLPGSQFKPNIIKDVAQNILSFLKSKATKAGHTYWLFKG
jgi:hypothetical protein